eukprot:CAMPEP_0195582300 /NCGR_PEP_ID=MMETSP0814-20130614/21903_1 /TAXON_ID=97485 /ORGANISM="Prymnesium parvum, Strain Texoma1" /LENGTH=46 /DNA_ID= /DNA_START= /DNA_END= /DNA_ORIENTATION=
MQLSLTTTPVILSPAVMEQLDAIRRPPARALANDQKPIDTKEKFFA